MMNEDTMFLITITVFEIQFPCRPLVTLVTQLLKDGGIIDKDCRILIATTYQLQIEFIKMSWPEPSSIGPESVFRSSSLR